MIVIDDRYVDLDTMGQVATGGVPVALSDDPVWLGRLRESRALLERTLARGNPVYGVSTGVGNRAGEHLAAGEQVDHGRLLAVHHGCGVGAPLGEAASRAVTLARLVSLAKGCSAVRVELLRALCDLLNAGVTPVIPRLGSVGASGDLTPLSYLASVLMGRREARLGGQALPAAEALARAGLQPLALAPKETLALMNGTSVMTALGGLCVLGLGHTLAWAERATALLVEVMGGRSGAFSAAAHAVKPHPGQVQSAGAIAAALRGSTCLDVEVTGRQVQDPYSMRCAPHVLGAARDALAWARDVLERELNSVNDNPLCLPDSQEVLFAGHFYGGHVVLCLDLVKNAVATVADLIDRQFALLLDTRHNRGLPETLVTHRGNGVKGLQITCTALTALIAQRAAPDAVQSRPTEVGNQDKVSMGQNAAVNAGEVGALLRRVLATLLIALSNAAHVRGEAGVSPAGRRLLRKVRACSPLLLAADRRLDHDIEALAALMAPGASAAAAGETGAASTDPFGGR